MTDTFTPPLAPSPQGSQEQDKARSLTAKFGDGYKQDSADGLNPIDRSLTLSWDPIQAADVATINAFLDAHVGVPFWYTAPREIAPRAWVWTSRQRSYPYPTQDSFSVTLEERFIY